MKLTLLAAISADGKIAQSPDQLSLDWTSKEDTQFFVSKTKELKVIIMGRKTYDTIGRPLKGRQLVVMTRSLEGKEPQEGLEYTSDSPEEIVADLTERGYEEAAIAGGSAVYGEFLRAGLVDELYLTVEPVLFGTGVPLAQGFERVDMGLIDTIPLNEGTVVLHYRIKK